MKEIKPDMELSDKLRQSYKNGMTDAHDYFVRRLEEELNSIVNEPNVTSFINKLLIELKVTLENIRS